MGENFNTIKSTVRTASRESSIFLKGGEIINDSFWYDVSKKYPGQIGIHLFPTIIDKSIAGARAFIDVYKQGLNELARRMESDPKLADITHVTGWSKIVYENPKLLELLGFKVTERDEEKKEALAIMSREDFLQRYGSKN